MAETVEGLLTEVGTDVTGLDRGLQESIGLLTRFAQRAGAINGQIPPLDIDTNKFLQRLNEAGGVSAQFFQGLRQGIGEELTAIEGQLGASGAGIASKADQLAVALDRAGQSTRTLAAASGTPVTLNVAPAIAAADTLIAKLGLVTRTAADARASLSTPTTATPTLLASQADTRLAQNATANAAALERMAAASTVAGREANVLSAATRGNILYSERQAVAAAQAAAAVSRGSEAFEGHSRAAFRATNAISSLAATSLGAEGPVARLAESALLFGGGELAVVGLASGVLALAAAYRFVTTAEREARNQQDALVQGLLTEAHSAIPAVISAQEALTAALESQKRARDGLTVKDVGETVGTIATIVTNPGGLFAAEQARQGAKAQADATTAVAQAERDLARAVQETAAVTARSLTQSISLRGVDAASLREGNDLVRLLKRESEDANRPLEDRIAKLQLANGLQQALTQPQIRRADNAAAQQATQDDLALTQQGITARSDALQQAFAHELISRETFFAQRRALTTAAERADVAALRSELTRTENTNRSDLTKTENKELDTTIRHLESLIALRQGLLRITEKQNEADEAARKQAILERAGIGTIDTVNGPVTQLQAPDVLQQLFGTGLDPTKTTDLSFKARLDLTEVRAALDRFAADTQRLQLDAAFEDARKAGEKFTTLLEERTAKIIKQIGLDLKDIGNANIVGPNVKTQTDQILELANGVGRVGDALVDVGILSQEAARQLGDVLDLSKSIATGDVAGIISGGIRVLGDVFGKSALEKERDSIIERNTAAIEHNTTIRDREGRDVTGEQAARAAEIAASVEIFREGGAKGGRFLSPEAFTQSVENALRPTGLDLTDLVEIAKRNDIQILDSHGNVIPEALDQFNEQVKSGAISMADLAAAANTAAAAMLNVPDVFKIEAARAAVQRAEPAPMPVTSPAPGTTNQPVPTDVDTGGRGKVQTRTSISTSIGTVSIVIQGVADPVAAAKAAREEFEKLAMRRNGNVDDWAGVGSPFHS